MKKYLIIMVLMFVGVGIVNSATLLGDDFSYQGELKDNSDNPLTGFYDFQFVLFEDATTSNPVLGANVMVENVEVTNGIFTTKIDFGPDIFLGNNAWMQIYVRVNGSGDSYTPLSPLQQIVSAPYAIHSQTSELAITVAADVVGANEVNSSEVQQRLVGNCSAGFFVSSVNENGTVNCSSNTVLAALISTLESKVTDLEAKDLTGMRCPIGQYITGFDSTGEPICGLVSVSRYTVMLCGTMSGDFDILFREIGFSSALNSCNPNNAVQAMLISRNGDISSNVTAVQNYIDSGGIVITEYNNLDEIFNFVFGTAVIESTPRYGACKDNINPSVQLNPSDPFWSNFDFIPALTSTTGCGFSVDAFPGITELGGWITAGKVSLAYRNHGLGRLWLVSSDWQDNSVDFNDTSKDMMKYMILHKD